ncbi:MAG TPA: BMP family ABC transporter substrate-binding protein [Pyrinomonadaceae bacterium]|nr:BMP family ABC transporter substrate-binding protein [Pyrinomonadaceae bacterium]
MKFKVLPAALFVCALALGSAACGGASGAADERGKKKVGIVFDIGGKDDRSFNAAAWEGMRRAAQDFDIVLRDIEPGNPTSIEPAMRAFAERGYDLIIGVGFAQSPIMQQVAKDYPEINFAIVDGVIDLPNVASLVFKEHEGSYLVGMIAARASKTNRIGFIGGMDIPLIHRFATGYAEGAKAVNPDMQVLVNYVGVTDHAWNNPGKGKELALAQLDRGADVIFTAAGNSGLGAFDAVEQYGRDEQGRARRFVIGVDSNQNMVKPGFVLTSMVKRVDNAVHQIVEDVVNGRFKAGFHTYGLDADGVAYAVDEHNRALIPEDVVREAEGAKARIIAGEIKVTDAMAPKK